MSKKVPVTIRRHDSILDLPEPVVEAGLADRQHVGCTTSVEHIDLMQCVDVSANILQDHLPLRLVQCLEPRILNRLDPPDLQPQVS